MRTIDGRHVTKLPVEGLDLGPQSDRARTRSGGGGIATLDAGAFRSGRWSAAVQKIYHVGEEGMVKKK